MLKSLYTMDVITAHTGADFDTLGAMVAAKKLYPAARVAFPGSMEKELEAALKTLVLPFKIERAVDIEVTKITRLIIVDTRSPSRIGRFSEIIDKKDLEVHTYDHHPDQNGDIPASNGVVLPYGSTTTILTLILKEKKITLSPEEATIMMAGIYEDTGSLSYGSTRVEDFDAARYLLAEGAVLSEVTKLLSHDITAGEVAALGDLIESETTYSIGGVEVTVAEVSVEDYSGEVSELARRLIKIERMPCLILLAQSTDRVHYVIRSDCKEVNAGLIAKRLGGGGHPEAASATVKGLTLIQAREKVLNHLKEEIVPKVMSSDIMSTPPITIGAKTTLKEASLKMLRFNINALPVTSGGKLKGVITRQIVDKAVGHGLGTALAIDYLSSDLLTIEVSTSIDEVRRMIPELGQRLLPVMDKGRLAGVITRTDLIKILRSELSETHTDKIKKKRVVTSLMRQQLPEWAFTILKGAGAIAAELGCEAYAVGGFVRDLLMRRENLDIDIVIEGDGIGFAKKFAESLNGKIKIHDRFKTAVIICPDGYKIDVATARLEYYEKPGALPTVELSSLKLDLYRRDFTINTLAVCLNPGSFGKILDFFNAQRDIKEHTLRILHNLSFVEDPTRAMRAVRFSERFGFTIAPHTENLLKNSVKLELLKRSSSPRIREELKNILKEDRALHAIGRLKNYKLLPLIDSNIKWDEKAERLFENARKSVAWYELLYRDEKIDPWLVLMLALTDNLKKLELAAFTKRLRIDNKKTRDIIESRAVAIRALHSISAEQLPTTSQVFLLLSPLPLELILYIIAKTEKPAVKKTISKYITELRGLRPRLKGKDLLKCGVKEGPRIGQILDKLLYAVIDGKVTSKNEEKEFVKELIK